MPAPVQAALDRMTGFFKQFSVAQRTFALIAVAALVLGGVALASWATKPTMAPLFSGLSGADASAVVDQLDAAGVSYQLTDGGSTVLVPTDRLYPMRIQMAAQGLPASSQAGGYSLLDDMPMTSSEFQQQTTYLRAVEGELARTIEAIDGVETASVKLAIPEQTVFVENKADPTASVFVKTRAGRTLSTEQVQAIVHLVSAGIDGMKSSDVAVIDASGQVLSAIGAEGGGAGFDGKRTADYEQRVSQALQSVLDPILGPGKSAVTVSAELNFDATQRTVEEFSATPDTPPLTETVDEESYTGTGGGAAGVLGPDNIQVPGGANGNGEYSSTSEQRQNAVNKSTETTTTAPGRVDRQSVAVLLDQEASAALDLATLQNTLAAAAGIDPERGDTIQVQRAVFDTSAADAAAAALEAEEAAAAAAAQEKLFRDLVMGGVGLLVALLLILWLVRRAKRSRLAQRERREALELEALRVMEREDPLLLDSADETIMLPPVPAQPPAPVEPPPADRKRAEIAALADEQPDEVAELLRGWLAGAGRGGDR
ncbi:flagellar M-ring protein FliF [Xylanimonas oleitrophica]|uniref:Flagellar M-ring protein n=1 Tax=Xylanimonas oleitrophica TaxID=2607479 RepID=A0A2W5X0D0_9MICO|nr:flagellar basal-body MS-ring/collar protein FliF [Xylanimonas oleitrophica]PZR54126.1 flagellar M-ring protein FliF [Xylanimonas oleitrophica]